MVVFLLKCPTERAAYTPPPPLAGAGPSLALSYLSLLGTSFATPIASLASDQCASLQHD